MQNETQQCPGCVSLMSAYQNEKFQVLKLIYLKTSILQGLCIVKGSNYSPPLPEFLQPQGPTNHKFCPNLESHQQPDIKHKIMHLSLDTI